MATYGSGKYAGGLYGNLGPSLYSTGQYSSGTYGDFANAVSTNLLSAREVGPDQLTSSGTVRITSVLLVSEGGQDSLVATGVVEWAVFTGSLSAQDELDQLVAAGAVQIFGTLSPTEVGDALLASGTIQWAVFSGNISAAEQGEDNANILGQSLVSGNFAGIDHPDVAESFGQVLIGGSLGSLENQDVLDGDVDVVIAGDAHGSELDADVASATATTLVSGVAVIPEQDEDAFAGQGFVQVLGNFAPTEPLDLFGALGRVRVTGQYSLQELSDSSTITGKVLVLGIGAPIEFGSDSLTGEAQAIVNSGPVALEEPYPADGMAASGQFGVNLTLSTEQALLLQAIYNLHGLSPPLTVSTSFRKAGEVYQEVEASTTSTRISTVTIGSDTLHKGIGAMIEELAAVHGITDDLVVTHNARVAGPVAQQIKKFGGVTTVTRQ